jgi:thiamine kinase-like enzyme
MAPDQYSDLVGRQIRKSLLLNDFVDDATECEIRLLSGKKVDGFKYLLVSNGKSYILQLRNDSEKSELISSLNAHLVKNGTPVSKILRNDIYVSINDKNYQLEIKEFIQGRDFKNSHQDIVSLLESCRSLHNSLKKFDKWETIKERSIEYSRQLDEIKKIADKCIKTNEYSPFDNCERWFRRNHDFLEKWYVEEEINFETGDGCQCLHGDILPGNVLFGENGTAYLFDFEYSDRTYGPVRYDLSYIFHRFCLIDKYFSGASDVYKRYDILCEYYQLDMSGIWEMIRTIEKILRRLITMVLYNFKKNNNRFSVEELDKFVRYHEQISKVKQLL